jgi:hypothetical protein
MRTLMLIAIAVLTIPSCTRYMHDGRRDDGAYAAHSAHHAHHGHRRHHEMPCDHSDDGRRSGIIGLEIGRSDASRGLVVEGVAPGGPADDANIRPGDSITQVDGESTRGMTEEEAARAIRGPVDTAVEIRVDSPRGDRIISLVRVASSSVWGMAHHRRGKRRCDAKKGRTHGHHESACTEHECDRHECHHGSRVRQGPNSE